MQDKYPTGPIYDSGAPRTETEAMRRQHYAALRRYVVRDNVVYLPSESDLYRNLYLYVQLNGMTINNYLELLGYKRTFIRPDSAVDVLEKDMRVHTSDGGFEERVFSSYALIGSAILMPETLARLNDLARKYIDDVIDGKRTVLLPKAKMQIALAIINHAKNWRSEDESHFWTYIAFQFGYRVDAKSANAGTSTVVRILQNSLEEALKRNGRLFIEDASGRLFKSTALVHALSPKKSWMALFEFLFDFYKNNLNWQVIPGDPFIESMIQTLRAKLSAADSEDVQLSISTRVYLFQNGIRKLIILRPNYTRGLMEKLLRKIDSLVNSKSKPATTYEEQLCEEWFKEKIISIANMRPEARRERGSNREVAVDYSQIRLRYVLRNEDKLCLSIPDIRLNGDRVKRASLVVFHGDDEVYQRPISWYGNELGLTLSGFILPINECISKAEKTLAVRVKIICDADIIFDSEESLYRQTIAFSGTNEISPAQMKQSNYTLVVPDKAAVVTENTEVTEIESFKIPGLKAFYLEMGEGYLVSVDGRLISFDSLRGSDIRMIIPAESNSLPKVTVDGEECLLAHKNSVCNLVFGKETFQQQYVLWVNGRRVELPNLQMAENESAFVYTCPLGAEEDVYSIQVINLNTEKPVCRYSFLLVDSADSEFNREFYFSGNDYDDAYCMVEIDGYETRLSFTGEDDEVRTAFRTGILHAPIPKVTVKESTGEWFDSGSPMWYIKNIPQDSMFHVNAPQNVSIQFFLNDRDAHYDGSGVLAIGNILHSISGQALVDIKVKLRGPNLVQEYVIASVSYRERFLSNPEFWFKDNKLYWNQGGGTFVGRADRTFTFVLLSDGGDRHEFKLSAKDEFIELPEDVAPGIYQFSINVVSGGLFSKQIEAIASGECAVGDQNVLRFINRRIVIETITDGGGEESSHIQITPCYIDQIKYLGIKETSEGLCPVYKGILYTFDKNGIRREFSYNDHINRHGRNVMTVNPVRIVYVGEETLVITNNNDDDDFGGEGLYFYYFDTPEQGRVYRLTDQEYTKFNRDKYSLADLYIYKTERI